MYENAFSNENRNRSFTVTKVNNIISETFGNQIKCQLDKMMPRFIAVVVIMCTFVDKRHIFGLNASPVLDGIR